jgi:hypothetical protein
MRSAFRQFLTYSLLATYAGISLLGEGLHWLTPDEHHHGASVVVSTTRLDAHDASDTVASSEKHFAATRGIADDHDCEICEFLAQAVSQPPQIADAANFDVLIVEVTCASPTFYSPIILGLHAPRGPPKLLA